MRLAIGADHAGFELKEQLKQVIYDFGYELKDFGAYEVDSNDGFPDYALPVARAVANNEYDRGVLVCGSGIGVSIAANKVKGIRAVNCTCEEFARLSRMHNDTNIICFPGRFMSVDEAKECFKIWMETDFLGGKYADRNKLLDF